MTEEPRSFTLDMRISIRNRYSGGGGLDVSEQVNLAAADFLEVAKILGQFHDLAQQISQARQTGELG